VKITQLYFWAWWQYGEPRHGWLAVVWLCYSAAAIGLAMVGD